MEWVVTPAGVIVSIAAVVGAGNVIWFKLWKPARKQYRKLAAELEVIHDIAQRELTHNGGTSLKDETRRNGQRIERLEGVTAAAATKIAETRDAVEAMAMVFDSFVDRKQADLAEIWGALAELGYERRHNPNERKQS